ncbi:TetR family transcriptional regulator C-terminal domain-containing protein [Microbacterium pseudoresistens]|uniref:BetI-type transcriptional repressor C-terminal domain-containing protein n=1 Tax=Microbacterium pseudoresistens TaxID=640634 RepID=A0A7Y9EU86_9MICO|nr:TetR family transcriptional regulator C-terminal domain-containing protein [Microbacterium pseudoresistens]NYD53881.1 hypothetical protein [Microbacterium pseudoresistens]
MGEPEHPARDFFLERTDRMESASVGWVEKAQREGVLRDDLSAEWIVRTLHALADGLQPLWLLDPDLDMAKHIEQVIELLRPPASD